MVKKTHLRSIRRDIKGSFARFIAIIGIVTLGVGFLIGALSTTPILQESVDAYYDETNTMDINVKSMYGFTDDDIEKIAKIGDIRVYGTCQIDSVVSYNGENINSRFSSIDEVNKLTLVTGNMPKENECLVKRSNGELKDFAINDEIVYNEKTYKIVGIVDSPLYYSSEGEQSTINMEDIDAFFYLDMDSTYYTDLYITTNTKRMNCFKQEYKDYVSGVIAEIKEIDENYYVLSRSQNVSYAMYDLSSKKVDDVAKIFPYFFFLVALLVTLATMTRMIEEERSQIGTLKALGYGKATIAKKYVMYSGIASIIGSIIGVIWGFIALPTVLYNTYRGLFILPNIRLRIIPSYSIISCAVIIASTIIATILSSVKVLKERPASLMIPRAPKPGKRILLERVKILWNRLSFSYKSTARNLFRYKKHFFMTVFGVAGCTALVLTGFGIRDSVNIISEVQYEKVLKYDVKINTVTDFDEKMNSFLENKEYITLEYLTTKAYNGKKEIDLTTYKVDKDINDYVSLNNRKTKKEISVNDESVILCETAAVMLGLKVNDEILVDTKTLRITDISENYTSNYLYLGPKVYEENFSSLNNVTFVNCEATDETLSEIYESTSVINAILKAQEKKTYSNMISSMKVFTAVLILAAGALGMIVIYNLTNIIIRERKKELATLRVLGYHTREVFIYIFREVLILAIIGAFVGLGLGVLLHKYVIYTAESMDVIFGRDIFFQSYLYSFVLTIAFTSLVGLLMIREITKIEMAESMKAVE